MKSLLLALLTFLAQNFSTAHDSPLIKARKNTVLRCIKIARQTADMFLDDESKAPSKQILQQYLIAITTLNDLVDEAQRLNIKQKDIDDALK